MGLTAIAIKKAGDGVLSDGKGLRLEKKGNGGKWIWRYSFAGKRREMGFGTWPTVGLADARNERDRWALILSQGKDPISERNSQKAAIRAELERKDPTLEELASEFFDVYKRSLRKDGASARWMSPLEKHIFPKIGRKPVSTITQRDVRDALKPIWESQHPTAEKAIQRLGKIFQDGRLRGYECDKFTIDAAQSMLGHAQHKTTSIEATPWEYIPELYAWLEGRGASASCLQFMILTLVRAGGCRQARFDEFTADIWTVPAEKMKGRLEEVMDFRVPLSPPALEIIKRRRELGGEWVFPGYRGTPLTDASLSKFLRDNGHEGKPHGFRTSFRTWVQDNDAAPYDVAETILSHKIGGKTERAYARSDLLDRRRPVMLKWARFVLGDKDWSKPMPNETSASSGGLPT
ncbi:tyrosine-type recombinase/integrase [Albidovulum sediminicola]|uniref:Integrase arm-type DNA-binding domain-containing protein n=1 Tax=Albidovulum sediminicola TaxID=2984331 RepID=A0ABT2Z137_9RHOB|nr:integrase arm-type DNA-binding domain-containing protein [Defluviimonas sp. WL0075]MCV2864836.1 integrase arm-type DNA-binding domain-containing protein [Defluviimonas sp. WL0075]